MKCLRIYATTDGESRFGEVDIPMGAIVAVASDASPFAVSAAYPASSIQIVRIPAGMRPVA